jgi:hypothetical protein
MRELIDGTANHRMRARRLAKRKSKLGFPRAAAGNGQLSVNTGPLVSSKADIRTAWQIVDRGRLLKNSERNGLFPVPRFITYGAPIN